DDRLSESRIQDEVSEGSGNHSGASAAGECRAGIEQAIDYVICPACGIARRTRMRHDERAKTKVELGHNRAALYEAIPHVDAGSAVVKGQTVRVCGVHRGAIRLALGEVQHIKTEQTKASVHPAR